ncbi:MAG: NAD(P)H-hydrate dehydratase [Actinomycetia bacterium]|nr:NAD(P)H-hydrate dehydratase [Actinomycetes bacterium]
MKGVYPVAEVRAAEAALMAELPPGALMQRAATALATHCARLLGRAYGARVVLLVGGGDNGGDALFAGARLAAAGARVDALLLDPARAHAAGLAALRRHGGRTLAGVDPALPQAADLIIDGILGIGGKGDLRGAAIAAADAVATARATRRVPTVAVDLPSGVDADTGWAGEHAIRADVTVTFGVLKPGLIVGAGARHAGEVRLVDIGLTPPPARCEVLEGSDVAALLAAPGAVDDKYTRGVVGVVAGSDQYPGAGVLATGAALLGGAGMVRYLGRAPRAVCARYPEVVPGEPGQRPHEARVQAYVVGPGLGTDDQALARLADVLRTDAPVIVDADAITLLARAPGLVRGRRAPTVLTPHDREFARLTAAPSGPSLTVAPGMPSLTVTPAGSSLDTDRIGAARRAAAELGVTVLLKGAATVVAAPDGMVRVNRTGTPWLATAGSGDVLSGLIGSLLAGGLDAPRAAAVGAYLHGVAGQLAAAEGPPTADDVLAALRPALGLVTGG